MWRPQVFLGTTFVFLLVIWSVPPAQATAPFQRFFIDEMLDNHPDKDYVKFMRRKVRCLICHQGKGGKFENAYGKHLAELLDPERDKKDRERVAAAIREVNLLPYDGPNSEGETFAERIANSKLPGGETLDALKIMPDPEPVELFDGTSLAGWVGAIDAYEVRDGAIYSLDGKHENLFTEAKYTDFEFSFEFMLTPGANNGISIRAPLEGDATYEGIELQILDNSAEQYAELQPYQFHGSAYGIAPAKRGVLKPVGEWNAQTIRCQGRKLVVVLNETTILDVDLDEVAPDGKTVDGKEHPGLTRKRGHIGLLGHGDVVGFRNLTVLPLTDDH